jgi:hypothetical protein
MIVACLGVIRSGTKAPISIIDDSNKTIKHNIMILNECSFDDSGVTEYGLLPLFLKIFRELQSPKKESLGVGGPVLEWNLSMIDGNTVLLIFLSKR